MTDLIIFKNPEFGEMRMISLDGEPWAIGKDISTMLGHRDTKSALSDHVDPEDKRIIQKGQIATLDIPNRGMTIINESGLYSLIMSSKLPGAKRFKHWVTSEVLPTIRKHGAYKMPVPSADAPPKYQPTRPLTTDDYEDAARTIAKCHNARLPIAIDLYRKAGLDIEDIPVAAETEEAPVLAVNERDKARIVALLNQYTMNELCEKLPYCKTSILYYRNGTYVPRKARYDEIIQILEG